MAREGKNPIGMSVGGYRIVSRLGAGAMGTVFLAEHPELGRQLAVKVLTGTQDAQSLRRFFNEARAASQLHHPNIVDVIDVNHLPDGAPYLLMEYVAGQSLRQRLLQPPPLTTAEILDILCQLASSLAAAHRAGIVHRDVKPDNIMVLPDGDASLRVKLLDFGIAKLLPQFREETEGSPLTVQGMVIGTPRYMAPEQARADLGRIGPAVDLYALGVIAYECLSRRPLFLARTPIEYALKHCQEDPPPLAELHGLGAAGVALERLVLRCLEKCAADRPASAEEIEEVLNGLRPCFGRGGGAVMTQALPLPAPLAMPTTALQPQALPPRPAPRRWIVGGVALLLLISGVALVRGRRHVPVASPAATKPALPAATTSAPRPAAAPAPAPSPARVAPSRVRALTPPSPPRKRVVPSPTREEDGRPSVLPEL